ncbi:MAG TPA: hypothetical protein VFK38_01115 [Candidatus Limnocylindrales bacterium]|nr:hypothetical protein [Candidatus Limnocylindrales bacterium]
MTGQELLGRLRAEGALSEDVAALGHSGWSNGPAARYQAHEHGYDKVLVAEHGSITFELPAMGAAVELTAGDRLDLPAGTLHAARVGPDGVACLEAHLPAGSLGATALLQDWRDRGALLGAASEPARARPETAPPQGA